MPEFLAEGQAIANLTKPDRVVIGTPDSVMGKAAYSMLKKLVQGQNSIDNEINIINTRQASSELGKLMANAMLA